MKSEWFDAGEGALDGQISNGYDHNPSSAFGRSAHSMLPKTIFTLLNRTKPFSEQISTQNSVNQIINSSRK
jgi:hypothetical protein